MSAWNALRTIMVGEIVGNMEQFTTLEERIKAVWSRKTASTSTASNPARGQCSVSALVVHDLLGGSILKTRIRFGWHFYNWVNHSRIDLTASQFNGEIIYEDLPATRDEALSDTSVEQYQELRTGLGMLT
jgi:hypothetical protein